jgi:hypothetical protein
MLLTPQRADRVMDKKIIGSSIVEASATFSDVVN